ncbi:protein NinB [Enterobacter sp. MGH86]|nr:recombination protein NinB [Enterobacter sp. MGH86]KLW48327.1 protein NinB [Enterobacter sp. MGH86]
MKQHYCIVNDTVKENLIAYIRTLPVNPRAPMVVEAREETRTDKQNRLMWPLLKDLSDQVVWHGEKLTREEWKDLITVLVNQTQDQEQKSAPGINGGRVYFGVRTSKSSKRYMVDVIVAIYWFGTRNHLCEVPPCAGGRKNLPLQQPLLRPGPGRFHLQRPDATGG